MGARGTSMNITDMSATYVTLKGMVDKLSGYTAEMATHKKGVLDEINNGAVDDKSAAELEELLDITTKIVDSINSMLEEVQKKLDAGLKACQEIDRIAKAQASGVQDRARDTHKKFKR